MIGFYIPSCVTLKRLDGSGQAPEAYFLHYLFYEFVELIDFLYFVHICIPNFCIKTRNFSKA